MNLNQYAADDLAFLVDCLKPHRGFNSNDRVVRDLLRDAVGRLGARLQRALALDQVRANVAVLARRYIDPAPCNRHVASPVHLVDERGRCEIEENFHRLRLADVAACPVCIAVRNRYAVGPRISGRT